MAGGQGVADHFELDSDRYRLTGCQRGRKFVSGRAAMSQVEHAPTDQRRDPIGRDITQAGGDKGGRLIGGDG